MYKNALSPSFGKTPKRQTLAHVAFILVAFQLILLTHPWWQPLIAQTDLGKKLFSLERLGLQNPTPLIIQVQEITQHPSQPSYWNIKIDIQNRTDTWVSYPHLVLSFLDDQKKVTLRNEWSPDEYAPSLETKALEPHEKKHLSLWLKLPHQLPLEYNLDYFYPY